MVRLLVLLVVGLFLTLLIGGQDGGPLREGLRPVARAPAAAPPPPAVAETPVAAPVVLTAYVPVAAPAPARPVVPEPVTAPPAAEAPAPAPEPLPEPAPDIRLVAADRINVREGPSTDFAVVGRLTRDEAVTVVAEAADGWLRVRIEGDGIEGFVAARLLRAGP